MERTHGFRRSSFSGIFLFEEYSRRKKNIHAGATELLRRKGYDYLTAVPTWWHTADICKFLGFDFQYGCDKETINRLNGKLSLFWKSDREKIKLDRYAAVLGGIGGKGGFYS